MATVNGVNVGSSIDTSVIVETLVNIYRSRYITPLETKKSKFTAEKTALNEVSLRLATLKSKMLSLESGTGFLSKLATSSSESVLTAAASTLAASGVYGFNVTQLAKQHKVGSAQFVSANTDISTAEGAGVKQFDITINGVTKNVSVNVTAGDTNQTVLTNIASAINSAGIEGVATVINETGSSSRLVISSNKTGLANAITMQDTSGTLLLNSSVLNGTGGFANQLQAALDATFTIDGLSFQRTSNEVSDAISGVTLQLKGTGTSNLTVRSDATGIRSNIQGFVDAYNDLNDFIDEQTSYDSETAKEGILLHTPSVRNLMFELRPLATGLVPGLATSINSLGVIGVEVDKTGKMAITDSTKLENYIQSNLADVQLIFNNGAGDGVGVRVSDYIDNLNSSGGSIFTTINSLTESIDYTDYSIKLRENSLASYQNGLVMKYAALDALLVRNQNILNNIGTFSLLPGI
jgi:flagellar hook-associated protein 2